MSEIKGSLAQQAKNEVQEERNEAAKERLKVLYRQLADAQDVIASINRKITIEEDKLS